MLADHIEAIRRVCFDSKPDQSDLAALGDERRWLVYRELVRSRLGRVIEAALPRTRAAVGSDRFGSAVDDWLATGGPKTRYFRRIPDELAEFAIPIWKQTCEPWVADLARYEISSWFVRHAPADPDDAEELSFDKRPVVAAGVRVLRLDYPVHQSPTPAAGYQSQPTILCLHRDAAHRAVPQVLNPTAADLLETWQRGQDSLTDSVHHVAKAQGVEIGPAFVDKLSTLLSDFITKGILLGARDDAQ